MLDLSIDKWIFLNAIGDSFEGMEAREDPWYVLTSALETNCAKILVQTRSPRNWYAAGWISYGGSEEQVSNFPVPLNKPQILLFEPRLPRAVVKLRPRIYLPGFDAEIYQYYRNIEPSVSVEILDSGGSSGSGLVPGVSSGSGSAPPIGGV